MISLILMFISGFIWGFIAGDSFRLRFIKKCEAERNKEQKQDNGAEGVGR